MFTGATDPIPYIAAAYAVALLILGAYTLAQYRLRKKLRQLESAMN